MLDVRVYRAAFLPALIAVFVAAFSLADRPAPTTTGLSGDAFDSGSAFGDGARPQRNSLNELARSFPDRAAGSSGDLRLADRVAQALGQRAPSSRRPAFEVTRTHTDWQDARLETVVGVRAGPSSRRIVVVASRDASGSPGRAGSPKADPESNASALSPVVVGAGRSASENAATNTAISAGRKAAR